MERKNKYYYIGFNANNAICNELFFDGSITLYPNKEKGNIYFSDKYIEDTKSERFLSRYKEYIYAQVVAIQSEYPNTKFLCFNDKIQKLCDEISDISIVNDNQSEIRAIFNDKYKAREYVKDICPILDYMWISGEKLDYKYISNVINEREFVVQALKGAGGDNTFLIKSKQELNELVQDYDTLYCVSKYVKNIPLNTTMVIGKYDIIILPSSVQLIIEKDNRFKYYGGDFVYINNLSKEIIKQINEYNKIIGTKLQKDGYRGVIGIDYILDKNNIIYFMEINPRFQASSFLINLYLENYENTCLAEQHFLAIEGKELKRIKEFNIEESFINCNKDEDFKEFRDYKKLENGYFEDNPTSNYRKIFNRSILDEYEFEKI